MRNKISVNAFTTGLVTPSARYRVRQLIPYLKEQDVEVNEFYSKSGAYPPPGKLNQIQWAASNLTENFTKILLKDQPKCDVSWLQKPLFSKHFTFERFLMKPIVFDVDDAIFLGNTNGFAEKIALISERIICGNNYLANHFSKFNKNIDIIPTAVDISKYDNSIVEKSKEYFEILWTGTSSNYKYLYKIESALKYIVDKYPFVKIKIISNERPLFSILEEKDFLYEAWSKEIEFSSIVSANLGIMPIADDEFSKGKCSYKMLCYMAGKLPVVVSPYGMNEEVLKINEVGFGADSKDDWISSMENIINSSDLQSRMGENGYRVVLENFDVNVIADKVRSCFEQTII
ncbi:hypothetical protein [Sphingobacterium sp. GVS05A]|uniref:hypothetical protein n=1 Tax=Sphingobacterium sp. GVS05A TaxID=2862679 RepID=UPI001CBB964D|nr:hypothetical protein [Sphingobacterium sp. GVS05A]